MNIKIAWLFPDTLYLHGDRGNPLAIKHLCEQAGHTAEIEKIDFDTDGFDPLNYDFIYVGAGEIKTFKSVIAFLKPLKEQFIAYIHAGKPMLVTGTSVGIFGTKLTRTNDSVIEGLDIVHFDAKEFDFVYGDDLIFKANLPGCDHFILGSQIQMIDIVLHEDQTPFGELFYGHGNNGKDLTEGAIVNNAIFTNTLGPILILNPWLTYALVEKILAFNGESFPKDFHFDTELEEKSYQAKVKYNAHKAVVLSNCPPLKDNPLFDF